MQDLTSPTKKELLARRDLLAERAPELLKDLEARASDLNALADELGAFEILLGHDSDTVEAAQLQEQIRRVALFKAPRASGHSGFRDRVREVIAANADGMKPAEVTAELERSGFVSAGKTSLSSRVQNELHRLRKNKELVRTDGKYKQADA